MNSYIPYHTSLTAGDILRDGANDALIIGEQENRLVERRWRTGYTMQNWRNANTVTEQTNALATLNNERNKITPPTLDFSAKPRGAAK